MGAHLIFEVRNLRSEIRVLLPLVAATSSCPSGDLEAPQIAPAGRSTLKVDTLLHDLPGSVMAVAEPPRLKVYEEPRSLGVFAPVSNLPRGREVVTSDDLLDPIPRDVPHPRDGGDGPVSLRGNADEQANAGHLGVVRGTTPKATRGSDWPAARDGLIVGRDLVAGTCLHVHRLHGSDATAPSVDFGLLHRDVSTTHRYVGDLGPVLIADGDVHEDLVRSPQALAVFDPEDGLRPLAPGDADAERARSNLRIST
jgi:hypothetical protein